MWSGGTKVFKKPFISAYYLRFYEVIFIFKDSQSLCIFSPETGLAN